MPACHPKRSQAPVLRSKKQREAALKNVSKTNMATDYKLAIMGPHYHPGK